MQPRNVMAIQGQDEVELAYAWKPTVELQRMPKERFNAPHTSGSRLEKP